MALKVIPFDELPNEEAFQDLENEIAIMARCRSPHIVHYERSYVVNDELWISMEFLGGGTLAELVRFFLFFHFYFLFIFSFLFIFNFLIFHLTLIYLQHCTMTHFTFFLSLTHSWNECVKI